MLLDRVRQLDERVELLRGGRVLAEPVLAQAQQLAHGAGVGIGVAQRSQDAGPRRAPDPPRTPRPLWRARSARGWRPGPRCRASSSPASVVRSLRRRVGADLRLLRRPGPGRPVHGLGRGPANLAQRGRGRGRRRLGRIVLPPELRRRVVDAAVGRVAVVGALRRPFAAVATRGAAFLGRARRRASLGPVASHLAATAACTRESRFDPPAPARPDRAAACRRCVRTAWRRRHPTRGRRSPVAPHRVRAPRSRAAGRALPGPRRSRFGRTVARGGCAHVRRAVAAGPASRSRRRHERWSRASDRRSGGAAWDRSQQIASVGGRAAYTKTPASMGGRLRLSKKPGDDLLSQEDLPPSTIGAGGLNCRVRNGNGCVPAAMATGICSNVSSRREPRRTP